MKKFTLLTESYNLERFSITREEFLKYKNEIVLILNDMYKDYLKRYSVMTFICNLPFENGREISIINKISTNVMVLKHLVRTFNLKNFDDIITLVKTKKDELFKVGTNDFNEILKLLKITEKYGDANELIAIGKIKSVIKSKLNLDIDPIKSGNGSYEDLILGIDITFKIGNRTHTCQVKPLISMKTDGLNYTIVSSGNVKQYKTDYLCFVNSQNQTAILFQNREVIMNGNIITIKNKYFVQ